jgi:hypothetical protein
MFSVHCVLHKSLVAILILTLWLLRGYFEKCPHKLRHFLFVFIHLQLESIRKVT